MSASWRRRGARAGLLAAAVAVFGCGQARAQDDDLVVRPAPPAKDDFETDDNRDGVPDGWYNLRDGKVLNDGGAVGPKFLRFECTKAGRPARLSRAFGIDGRKYEAILLGLWLRAEQIQAGERYGEDPGLIVDFLGDKLRQETRGSMGPWTARTFASYPGPRWTHVVKRIPVPAAARDAIMSVGLLGATGVLDVDGLTMELIPLGGASTTNLVRNPGFELGDPDPAGWFVDNGARRVFPGAYDSPAAVELARSGARCLTGLALPVEDVPTLSVSVTARGAGLRGAGGAQGLLFFVDESGRPLSGLETGVRAFLWSGSFNWRVDRTEVPVPRGSVRAVFQIEKTDNLGSLRVDDVTITTLPDPTAGTWTPDHVEDDTTTWAEVSPLKQVEARSALDFSFLHEAAKGRVEVKSGRFHYAKGGERARFYGVQLLPPAAFLEREKADLLADRLSRLGVNLVRLGELDTPLGPDRSLFDDTLDDTKHLDEGALARLDHLIAALKARGIYVAVELLGGRRFRSEDGVKSPGSLPPGGGPPAVFDPVLAKKAQDGARALLNHVNPETGLALKADPVLAWVTLAGEVTMFELIEHPNAVPSDYQVEYRALASKSTTGSGRRFWQAIESSRWKELADVLRKDGLKAPVAGGSHWRREREFSEVQAAPGLDLVDDRIFWNAPTWLSPRVRSFLWSRDGGLIPEANKKRRTDRPYVLGQWCDYTMTVWSSPFEAAEQVLAARTAQAEDWDAIVRRGIFIYPEPWGASAPGTAGGEDIFQVPAVANAAPHVYALWPHAASLYLRGGEPAAKGAERQKTAVRSTRAGARHHVPGWEPERGRLVVDTPYTQGIAGWADGEPAGLEHLRFEVESTYATVLASSAGPEPIASAKRLLVTAVGRIEPTGYRWADPWRRETADPGRPPLRQEPVIARVVWKKTGTVKAYALDGDGKRVKPAKVEMSDEGARLVLDGTEPSLHWELIAE